MYGGTRDTEGMCHCEHCDEWYYPEIGPPGHICDAMRAKWASKPFVPEGKVAIGVIGGVNGREAFVRPAGGGQYGFEYDHKPWWFSSAAEADFILSMMEDDFPDDGFFTVTEAKYAAEKAARFAQKAKAAAMKKVQNAKRTGMSNLPQVPTGQSGRKRVADSVNADDSMFGLWKQALSKGYGPRP